MKKFAIIIAGPSGAGKTTVANLLIDKLGNLEMSRSATTRAKRGDGRDDEYIYLTKEEFLTSVESGDMLESTLYGDNLYGTRKCEMERIWSEGKNPILVLDYNGVISLKQRLCEPVFAVYVYTTLEEAEKRLIERDKRSEQNDKSLSVLKKRISANLEDYGKLHTIADVFDCYVENQELNRCYVDIITALDKFASGEEIMSSEQKKIVTESFLANTKSFK